MNQRFGHTHYTLRLGTLFAIAALLSLPFCGSDSLAAFRGGGDAAAPCQLKRHMGRLAAFLELPVPLSMTGFLPLSLPITSFVEAFTLVEPL